MKWYMKIFVKSQLARVCETSQILKYLRAFLLVFSESCLSFPQNGSHDRNMQNTLTKEITFTTADGNTFANIDFMPQRDEFHKKIIKCLASTNYPNTRPERWRET